VHGKRFTEPSESGETQRVFAQTHRQLEARETLPRTILPQCQWNRTELLERLEGDLELLRELLSLFRENALASLANSRVALAHSDSRELSRSAHTMKGMLRNLSMNAPADIAAALEISADQQRIVEAGELLTQLEISVAGILLEVEAQLIEVKA